MNITIAHLYYDLLNLYGENGNVKALKLHLDSLGIKTTVKFLTITDDLKFDDYDIVYMGMGTEENQKIVLDHLLKYKKDIKKSIENNAFFLITGNSIELFGKTISDKNKKNYKCLNIFNYNSKEETFRMSDESLFTTNLINEYIIGFQNQSSVLKNNDYPMFNVKKGIGSFPKSSTEGIHYKNFYGTYLIGPFLIRNPYFIKYFIKEILNNKNWDVKLSKLDLKLDIKAYKNYLNNFYTDFLEF